jgi:hypothetical protein
MSTCPPEAPPLAPLDRALAAFVSSVRRNTVAHRTARRTVVQHVVSLAHRAAPHALVAETGWAAVDASLHDEILTIGVLEPHPARVTATCALLRRLVVATGVYDALGEDRPAVFEFAHRAFGVRGVVVVHGCFSPCVGECNSVRSRRLEAHPAALDVIVALLAATRFLGLPTWVVTNNVIALTVLSLVRHVETGRTDPLVSYGCGIGGATGKAALLIDYLYFFGLGGGFDHQRHVVGPDGIASMHGPHDRTTWLVADPPSARNAAVGCTEIDRYREVLTDALIRCSAAPPQTPTEVMRVLTGVTAEQEQPRAPAPDEERWTATNGASPDPEPLPAPALVANDDDDDDADFNAGAAS